MTSTTVAESIRAGVAAGMAEGIRKATRPRDLEPPPSAERVAAWHESGHATSAVLLGLSVGHASIGMKGEGEAALVDLPARIAARVVGCRHRARMTSAAMAAASMAGAVAAAQRFDLVNAMSESDEALFRESVAEVRKAGVRPYSDEAIRSEFEVFVRSLAFEERAAIEAVATALETSREVPGETITALVLASAVRPLHYWRDRLAATLGIPTGEKSGRTLRVKRLATYRPADPFDTPAWREFARNYVAGTA